MRFFKKNIAFTVSVLVLLVSVIAFGLQFKESFFPDVVIQKEANDYAKSFVSMADNLETSLIELKTNVDTLAFFSMSREEEIAFLMKHIQSNERIRGLMVLQHSGRFSTLLRDNNSFIFASDSTSKIDDIVWYRVNEDAKILNSWSMSLGLSLNLLSQGEERFTQSLKDQIPQWSSTKTIYGNTSGDIATHITWNDKNNGGLITCIATVNDENFVGNGHVFEDKSYQSFLVNSREQIILLHNTETVDSAKQIRPLLSASTETWEKTGRKMPGTYTFSFNQDIWWGHSVLIPIRGITGIVLNVDENGLYYSSLLKHIEELIAIVVLLLFTVILFVKARNRSHVSLSDFIKKQANDSHASELIKQGESMHLEFKSSFRYDYHKLTVNKDLESVIAKSVAAFSNAKGGTLLIGINDDGDVLGLENDINTLKRKDIDFFENTLIAFLNKTFSVSFVSQNIRIKFPVVNQKAICRIDIDPSSDPVFVVILKNSNKSERFYVRSGNTSQEIVSLSEINEYIQDRFSEK